MKTDIVHFAVHQAVLF